MEAWNARLERAALTPLTRLPRAYLAWVVLLLAIIGWGAYAYSTQVSHGLIVTGMRNRIVWGVYIANFVFFIGISHAGTLISAVLRIARAPWRVPVTRMAEFVTVVALMVGVLMPVVDMGRPDRFANIALFGRWQSPVLWDVLAITTYLAGSLIYLYLPLIPDLALCRDAIGGRVSSPKRWLYTTLAVGWVGAARQRHKLGTGIAMMMIAIVPVMVSVHTVVAWIFGMMLRSGWNSTVLGIYFVSGAVFSGVATVIMIMAVLRKAYHLEEFITERQFRYLGYLLGTFAVVMVYFNLTKLLTAGYKVVEGEGFWLQGLMTGSYSSLYWAYSVGGLVVPAAIVFVPWTSNILGVVIAATMVNVSMWVERYVIVVSSLAVPLMPDEPATYTPTWVEWSIIAATFALFALLISLLARLVPVVSVWEMKEQPGGASAVALGGPGAVVAQASGGDDG